MVSDFITERDRYLALTMEEVRKAQQVDPMISTSAAGVWRSKRRILDLRKVYAADQTCCEDCRSKVPEGRRMETGVVV